MTSEERSPVARSVEARGRSVVEAIATAAATLGVKPSQVRSEVLAAPKRGLFAGSRTAHVRVWVEATPRQRAAGPSTDSAGTVSGATTAPDDAASLAAEPAAGAEPATDGDLGGTSPQDHPENTPIEEEPVTETNTDATPAPEGGEERELTPQERLDQLDEEAEIAADFVEGMLDLLSLPGDIEIVVREEQALVNINEVGSGLLIGRRGATLDALQELVRCATQRKTERRSHVRVDVEGYRERQLEKLREKCRDAIAEVREHGEAVRLEPMDPYERKMMHDVVAKAGGVTSTSEGNEPRRRVVIHPAED